MDLRAQVLSRHDKQNMLLIRDYIGNSEQRFARLMRLFFSGEYRIQQRSSWAVMHCCAAHPELIRPYLEQMVRLLGQPVHDAVKRNITRIFSRMTLPESLYGEAADQCFRLLGDPSSPVAIKVFSMRILEQITRSVPELAGELKLLIEENLAHSSAAFHSAARKTLKQLGQRCG